LKEEERSAGAFAAPADRVDSGQRNRENQMPRNLEKLIEDGVHEMNGQCAIAYAILQLAAAQNRTADAIDRLGLSDAATPMGAIEFLAACRT
jgi:hypothetical protein